MNVTEISMSPDGKFGLLVTELWNKGFGAGSIALQMKVPTKYVHRYLKEHKLSRTLQQAIDVRKQNKISYLSYNPCRSMEISRDDVLEAMKICKSNAELAKHFQLTINSMINIKRKFGIKWTTNNRPKQYSIYDTE